MSGFCLRVFLGRTEDERPLHHVDLGASGTTQSFAWGPIRLGWSFREQSRQWWTRERDGYLLFVEGQPDRHPSDAESLTDWLGSRRWGSYRGFEIPVKNDSLPELSIFVDPLATRPLYFHRGGNQLLVSDKLSTIALNSPLDAELNWPALLEGMTLGSVYTFDTTLNDVEELAAGEAIRFLGTKVVERRHYEQPLDEEIDLKSVRSDPARTLYSAMKKAVAETWIDPDAWLLLSGGLDSRLVLSMAGPGRKALTLDLYKRETAIAREIAARCGADLRVLPHLPSDLALAAELAVPVGGGMHDPLFFNNLGMGGRWRADGITAVTHAYLFDTLLKGYFLLPPSGHSRSLLSKCMPKTAKFFERASGRGSPFVADDVIDMLTQRGKEIVIARLSTLDASLKAEVEDGLDVAFERRVLARISRQVHYGNFLGWCEELDVSSPIFHPGLWSWYAHSSARDRQGGKTMLRMMLSVDHNVMKVIDANTGAPPRILAPTWRDVVRRNPLYQRFLQPAWKRVAGKNETVRFGTGIGDYLREELRMLEEGLACMKGHELFDPDVIQSYRKQFVAGDDRYLEPLLVCGSVGRWSQLVRDRRITGKVGG